MIDYIHKPHKNVRLIACCVYSLCWFLDNNDQQIGVTAQGVSFYGLAGRFLNLSNRLVPGVSFLWCHLGPKWKRWRRGQPGLQMTMTLGQFTPTCSCTWAPSTLVGICHTKYYLETLTQID